MDGIECGEHPRRGRQPSHGPRVISVQQDAEKVRQRRSRITQKLNLPSVRLGLFARCGLVRGTARLGAPGLGG